MLDLVITIYLVVCYLLTILAFKRSKKPFCEMDVILILLAPVAVPTILIWAVWETFFRKK
jgi:hypothetical protein